MYVCMHVLCMCESMYYASKNNKSMGSSYIIINSTAYTTKKVVSQAYSYCIGKDASCYIIVPAAVPLL